MTALLALWLSVTPLAGRPVVLSPADEARALAIGKNLRCAVCQGMSAADSPAELAQAMMARVRELIAGGESDGAIYAHFVERYGEWVLLDPPARGLNWLIWLGPLALLLAGGLLLARYLGRHGSSLRPQAARAEPPGESPQAEDPYLAQVRSETEW